MFLHLTEKLYKYGHCNLHKSTLTWAAFVVLHLSSFSSLRLCFLIINKRCIERSLVFEKNPICFVLKWVTSWFVVVMLNLLVPRSLSLSFLIHCAIWGICITVLPQAIHQSSL